MTVGDLIDILLKHDPDATVVVTGYEDGYDDPDIRESFAILDSNWNGKEKIEWFFGQHSICDANDLAKTKVVVIGR